MIPADIKEMAKHDELVAEVLALGGPFFYKDYQRMRNGRASDAVRDRTRKAQWAAVFFSILFGAYLVLFTLMYLEAESSDSIFMTVNRVLSVALYGGMTWTMFRAWRRQKNLLARIDAGEFSTD